MLSFNRKEQIALLLLCGALIVGGAVSLLDRYTAQGLPDFDVQKGAVAVPADTASPAGAPVAADTTEALLDLNRASVQDLVRLPRIGPQTARRIVEYREQNGPFKRVEDLKAVRGIGPKTLEHLRPHIAVIRP